MKIHQVISHVNAETLPFSNQHVHISHGVDIITQHIWVVFQDSILKIMIAGCSQSKLCKGFPNLFGLEIGIVDNEFLLFGVQDDLGLAE